MRKIRFYNRLNINKIESKSISIDESKPLGDVIKENFSAITSLANIVLFTGEILDKEILISEKISDTSESLRSGINIYYDIFNLSKSLSISSFSIEDRYICFDPKVGIFAVYQDCLFYYNFLLQREYKFKLNEIHNPDLVFIYKGEPAFYENGQLYLYPLNKKEIVSLDDNHSFFDYLLFEYKKISYSNNFITMVLRDGSVSTFDLINNIKNKAYFIAKNKRNIYPKNLEYLPGAGIFYSLSEKFKNLIFEIYRNDIIREIEFTIDLREAIPIYNSRATDADLIKWLGIGYDNTIVLRDEPDRFLYIYNPDLINLLKKDHILFTTGNSLLVVTEGMITKFDIST